MKRKGKKILFILKSSQRSAPALWALKRGKSSLVIDRIAELTG
jgi:hypothetical protein